MADRQQAGFLRESFLQTKKAERSGAMRFISSRQGEKELT